MSIMVRKKMEGDVRKSVWIFLWMPECGNHGSYFSSYYGLKKKISQNAAICCMCCKNLH